jgi:non-specific serine/threonine protein kinase/serine/threonine-protein kinase
MELVEGAPITTFCRDRGLGVEQRLQLFVRVCLAVQHAHQKGVIHRDLKPSNVLVGSRLGPAAPKVIDFGVATTVRHGAPGRRAAEPPCGTPRYMAPEQIRGDDDVDTRADVYALGALLFELLTGQQASADDGAPSPARTAADVPRPLRWIVERAMAPHRSDRYATTGEMADDVSRWLTHRPVVAAPPDRAYRAALFLRRNRLVVAATTSVAVAVVVALASVTVSLRRTRDAEARARIQAERLHAVQAFWQTEMLGAISPQQGNAPDITMREVLDRTALRLDDGRFAAMPDVAADIHRNVGKLYRRLGRFDAAMRHLGRAVQLRRELEEAGDDLGRDLAHLAECQIAIGGHRAARASVDEARQVAAHTDLEPTLEMALGALDRHDGDWHGAAAHFERSLALLEAAGAPGYERAEVLNNLGALASSRGDPTQALELLGRARDLLVEHQGAGDIAVAICEGNLALALLDTGDVGGAGALLRGRLATCERLLPADHPTTAITLVNLGAVEHAAGDLSRAIAFAERALAMLRAVFGDRHEQVGNCLNNLAGYLECAGRLDAAEVHYREALAVFDETVDPSPDTLGKLCYNLGSLLRKSGRAVDAEPLLRRGLELGVRVHGHGHPANAERAYWLGVVSCENGDLETAGAAFEHAVAASRARPDERESLASALHALGTTRVKDAAFAAAVPPLEESLAIRREAGGDDWLCHCTAAMLGHALTRTGDLARARGLLEAAVEAELPAEFEVRRAQMMRWLVELYDALGESELVDRWQSRIDGERR